MDRSRQERLEALRRLMEDAEASGIRKFSSQEDFRRGYGFVGRALPSGGRKGKKWPAFAFS